MRLASAALCTYSIKAGELMPEGPMQLMFIQGAIDELEAASTWPADELRSASEALAWEVLRLCQYAKQSEASDDEGRVAGYVNVF